MKIVTSLTKIIETKRNKFNLIILLWQKHVYKITTQIPKKGKTNAKLISQIQSITDEMRNKLIEEFLYKMKMVYYLQLKTYLDLKKRNQHKNSFKKSLSLIYPNKNENLLIPNSRKISDELLTAKYNTVKQEEVILKRPYCRILPKFEELNEMILKASKIDNKYLAYIQKLLC